MGADCRYRADIETRTELPPDIASAAAARRFVRQTLSEWDLVDVEEAATLAVSELVTNAVLHARSGPTLVLRLSGERLRIEVHDRSPVLPARKHYGIDAGTGRGIVLLEALVQAWGAELSSSGGKVVWFELTSGPQDEIEVGLDAQTMSDLQDLGLDREGPGSASTTRHPGDTGTPRRPSARTGRQPAYR
ncbi:MAG: hypothetical protein QOG64_537 [Acidimicrobiaceae bacterium]|nr:hypothetical protein [Acidimicrobiaceae bacterium]